MRLKDGGLEKFMADEGIGDMYELCTALDITPAAVRLLLNGNRMGYDLATEIYNKYGASALKGLVDFEDDSFEGFKAKYVEVGARLY